MECGMNFTGFKYRYYGDEEMYMMVGGPVAVVFEDPSVDASDVKISRTGSQQLAISGTGFNSIAPHVIDFDPPLDTANLNIEVSSHERVLAQRVLLVVASIVLFNGTDA